MSSWFILLLSTFSYGSVVYVSDEENLKNIFTPPLTEEWDSQRGAGFTIGTSTSTQDILVIPPLLLKNLSDENKKAVKKLYLEKKCEFAGTTYTEVILPVLFSVKLKDDVKEQIEKGREIYYEIFGSPPSIFYPYLGIISKDIVEILRQSGYSVILATSGVLTDLKNAGGAEEAAPDLSRWTGSPVQNLAWDYIKQAMAKLDEYANSKLYNGEKFNAAMEELYNLEKPIWFENYASSDEDKKKENDLWFRAGLSNVYRAIDSELPAVVSVPLYISAKNNPLIDTTSGEYMVYFEDNTDNVFISSCNLMAFGVKKTTGVIIFDIFVSSISDEVIDIYIDMNKKNNAGSTAFLPGHNGFTDSISAWEYAVSVSSFDAKFYRYNRTGPPVRTKTFTVSNFLDKNLIEIIVPERYILGNPKKWGYVVAGFLSPIKSGIFDIIGFDLPPAETIIQIPALRIK